MEINIDNYISEDEKKEIVISEFKDSIHKAFGGDEYSQSGKERDRVIKNAVHKWISDYVESILTEEEKTEIKDRVEEAIKEKDYSYWIFQKPDVWDRQEYTFNKILQKTIKDKEDFIANKIGKSIEEKFNVELSSPQQS